MGFVKKTVGAITGSAAADAAKSAAETQARAGEAAVEEARRAREEARRYLQPFVDPGVEVLDDLRYGAEVTPGIPGLLQALGVVDQPQLSQIARSLRPEVYETGREQRLLGEVSGLSGQLDPAVLASPEFEAAQQEAAQSILASQAARGKEQAGQTSRALARESLLLGRQFAQQDLQNRLAAQQQRFGQLQSSLGFGAGEQQQRFAQLLQQSGLMSDAAQQELQNKLGIQAQRFSQEDIARQREYENQLAARSTRFGELLNIAQLGQASAAGQASGAMQSGAQVGNLLTDIGAAQAAGQVGAAQARSNAIGQIANTGVALYSASRSDARLKTNIEKIGYINDIPWYKFDYIDGENDQRGTMAQDILVDYPEAVYKDQEGYYIVDYGALPIWR